MTITHQGQGQFTVKSKDATIKFGPVLAVGDRTIPGPGEYDLSGVEIEGIEGGLYLVRTEEIFLLYLDRLNRTLTDKELEAVELADILFVPVGGNETDVPDLTVLSPEAALKAINQIDPRIVIPMYYTSLEPFRKVEGRPLEMVKELKVTRSTLPQEDRVTYVLE